jgi:hypothetical protein
VKTVTYNVVIPADRQLHVTVPEDVPPGPAEIVLVIAPEAPVEQEQGMTAGDLLQSPLCGIWKDRADIGDSVQFARSLRSRAEQRSRA